MLKPVITILLLNFAVLKLQAHVPIIPKADSSTSNPLFLFSPLEKSRAVYTQFESADDVDVYQFSVTEAELKNGEVPILIGSLVPACEVLKELLISWVLVGPEQRKINLESVPNEITEMIRGANVGIIDYEINAQQGPIWREEYTAHNYFRQKNKIIKINSPGTYQVYIRSQNKVAGDYVFEFGDKEIWSIWDILKTIYYYPTLIFEKEIETQGCKTD